MKLGSGNIAREAIDNYFYRTQKTLDRETQLRQREADLRRRELALANRLNADEMKRNPLASPEVRSEIHKLADRIVEKAYNPLRPVSIRVGVNKTPVTWNSKKVRRGVQTYSEDVHEAQSADPSCVTPTGKLRSGIKKIKPFGRMRATDAEPKTPAVTECVNSKSYEILKRKAEQTRTRKSIQEAASQMKDECGRVTNPEPSAKTLVRSPLTNYYKIYPTGFSSESDRGVNIDLNMPKPNVPMPRIKVDMDATMNDVADSIGKETLTRNGRPQAPGQKQRLPRKPTGDGGSNIESGRGYY